MRNILDFFNVMLITFTICFSFTTGAFVTTKAELPMVMSIMTFGFLLILAIGKVVLKSDIKRERHK